MLGKQIGAMVIGIALFLLFSALDLEPIVRKYPYALFFAQIALLLLLIPFGNDDGTGNKSWISLPGTPFNLQPGELVKLSFVLLLSLQFSAIEKRTVSHPLSILLTAGQALLLGTLLFYVSGDLGMVLLYLALYLIIAFSAGVHPLWFLGGFSLLFAAVHFLWGYLPHYIQMRFLVVFDHSLDPQGKGFQQLRSLLAIGSGRTGGQGYLQGGQSQSEASSSLPARHTDFIFSVAGEELGLLGTALILLILSAIVLRCFWIGAMSEGAFSRYAAVGFGGMVAVQTTLNISMCLFLAPVVGLTLPFFSYGGSSLISLYAGMGIVANFKARAMPHGLLNDGQMYNRPLFGVSLRQDH